ncbi:MAG: S8 family serine peptidase [Verrucomicrobiota bacterium]|nr:S8 family serine peptidase [Verrucomicrobiota bacterium]
MVRLHSFVALCLFPMALLAQPAVTLPEVHRIATEHGERVYEVAKDELAVDDASGQQQVQKQVAVATAQAARLRAVTLQGDLVVYEQGQPRGDASRRIVRKQLAVRLRPGVDTQALAVAMGLRVLGAHPSAPGYVMFEAADSGAALLAVEGLRNRPEVTAVEPQLARQQRKRFIPNDTLFTQQWHLRNTGQSGGLAGADVNVTSVWDNYKGAGLSIGVIDDGLQTGHPDLSANVDTVNDRDWNDGTPDDPNPLLSADFHGTSCAGVAAGRGNNNLGISGAAPEATLVGLRLIGAATTDSQEAEAMGWRNDIIQVKTNSWGPVDDARTLEGPGTLTLAALQTAATSGRGGKGTIILWAGGNGGDVGDDSNYDGYANSIYTIAVAALGNTGTQAYYSEPGANLVVTAPSNGGTLGIVTTDLVGASGYNTGSVAGELLDTNYTNDFGGTSSATPLAAGCVALLLQANPNLGWRDVQEILIRSASKVNAADTDWADNAAGIHFNHKYGAGLINTQAAVTLASSWTNLVAQTSTSSSQTGLSVAIPDNNATGITRSFDLSASNLRVEQVTLTLSATHTSRGHLAVTLTSPSGMVSRLAERHVDTGDHYNAWTFSSVRCWGENSQGTWTLRVSDVTGGTTGTLTAASLTVHGTVAGPVNQPPVVSAATLMQSATVFTDQTLTLGTVSASDPESDAITLAYQWQRSTDNSAFTDIASATGASLALNDTHSGGLIRCRITPSANTQTGAAFLTDAVTVNRRPARIAQVGTSYSYDSDLFLVSNATSFSRDLIINEFSQGAQSGANREWCELLVLKTTDLRGYTLADRSGTYTTFANVALWSAVAPGTTIVIFKATERDATLPSVDDLDPADRVLVIGHSNASAFTGGTWGGLGNSGAEALIIRNISAQIVDAVSFNNDNVYDAKLASVGSTKAAFYTGDTETGVDTPAQWTIGNASAATPGAGNGGINTTFVTNLRSGAFSVQPQFRLAATSASVPGLSLDATTGLLAGIPTTAGVYPIIIERFVGSVVVSQSFTLLITTNAAASTIAAGQTWIPDSSTTVPGDLQVLGNLDTNGHAVTVNGTLSISGTITNNTGILAYLHRSGPLPPGQIRLIANPTNDIADPDGDGTPNLLEYLLGTDPSASDSTPVQVTAPGQQLQLQYRLPIGIAGVTPTVEVTNDLTQWQTGPGHTEIVSDSSSSGFRTLIIRDAVPGPQRFIRLRVTRQ